ncbi:LiaF transmembrane domain-containing protein [Pedobacter yulinensis]|nr:LiaF domain-containing protein [Pedobacter yulinensis]
MDTSIKYTNTGKAVAGVILVGIGLAFLMRDMNFMPHWVYSWSSLVFVVGLFAGYKSGFRYGGWIVPVGIGLIFTASNALDHDYDLSKNLVPLILIFLGLYSIFKPANYRPYGKKAASRRYRKAYEEAPQHAAGYEGLVDASYIFTSTHQHVYDKHLKGGSVAAIFGGGKLDLSNADLDSVATLNLTAIFGGIKIYVPAHWQIKTEVSCLLGGVDDKRKAAPEQADPAKVLIISGIAFCGGIEILSPKTMV